MAMGAYEHLEPVEALGGIMRFIAGPLTFCLVLMACESKTNEAPKATQPVPEPVSAESVKTSDPDCPDYRRPIGIVLKNNGTQPTRLVSWHFSVHRVDHSTELAPMEAFVGSDPERTTDRIIQPGEKYKVCSSDAEILDRSSASPSSDLIYQVVVTSSL